MFTIYQPLGTSPAHPRGRPTALVAIAIAVLVMIFLFSSMSNTNAYFNVTHGGQSGSGSGLNTMAQPHQPEQLELPKQPQQPQPSEQPGELNLDLQDPPQDQNRRFVVLVPATAPSPNLCKFLLSAIALGYPSPVIVNWGVDFRNITKWDHGRTMSKIPGVTRYLDAVLREDAHPDDKLKEDDLVLIADGYDIWFQLPPEVLLRRYHDINAKANARLRQQWGRDSPMPMRQSIITASQKRCYPPPKAGSVMRCDVLPESPLRVDLYGSDTDNNFNETDFHHVRPRFINGGTYMGPAGDLRRMFRRALFKLESAVGRGEKLYSEQGVTGEVLGEQETWRKWRREHDVADDDAMAMTQQDHEFYIGMDYKQELSIPTVFSEEDGVIITLNNKTGIDMHSAALGISPVRLQGVPDDISAAQNPLEAITESPDWGDMPLYADFFTEAVPALLHHNAHVNSLKERRVWWWDQTWFFNYLRQLLTLRLTPGELAPLANVKTGGGNVTYWAPQSDKVRRKPRSFLDSVVDPLAEMEFETLCQDPEEDGEIPQPWSDEVFRDGKGPI